VKILSLVKYSLDVAEIKVDPSSGDLRMAGVPARFGDLDKGAVEAAVRLKEAAGEVHVEVMCLGPVEARSATKDLLAMGVDEATVIVDPFEGAADASVAVSILEAAIRKRGPFDLILCGFASDDGYSFQTGPRLAERLNLPFVSYACELNVDGLVLKAERDLENLRQSVTVGLPAIASVAEEAFPPRRVTLLEAMKAQKKPCTEWGVEADLGLSLDATGSSPEALQSLRGIVVDRKRMILEGEDQRDLADRFIDALVSEDILILREGA
jgi:electron transfer flavoprotein beta subunit